MRKLRASRVNATIVQYSATLKPTLRSPTLPKKKVKYARERAKYLAKLKKILLRISG
jgi:hypothetical protein